MTRFWDRAAGVPIDALGLGLLVALLVTSATLAAVAWHFYPRWLPRRSWLTAIAGWWKAVSGWFKAIPGWWKTVRRRLLSAMARWRLPRWRRPGWRRRQRPAAEVAEVTAVLHDSLPDRPAAEFTSLADRLAAQGRYAEAVRERLRGMVRELVDASVISHHPEWTVTELARAAATRRQPLGPALHGASRVFSDIWYGQRPALAAHDEQMRRYAAEMHAHVALPVPAR